MRNIILAGDSLEQNAMPQFNGEGVVKVPGKFKGNIAVISMDRTILAMHLLLIGATGVGKTNMMKHMLPQIIERLNKDDVMLVFDSKMDFLSLQRETDLVISNCKSGNNWNIFMDVVADGWDNEPLAENASEVAELLFSEAIEKSSQPFFPRAARDVFASVLQAMCRTGAHDDKFRVEWLNNQILKKYITKLNADKLYDFLKEYPDLLGVMKYIGDGKSDQSLGVFAELQSVVNSVFSGSFNKNGRLSVRHLVKERKGRILFIQYDPSCGLTLKPAYQTVVDLFLKESLSTGKCMKGNIYVVCDELKMLPKLRYFEDALNFGRSLGISVICGIQSMQQLYEVYGECGGKNIAAGFQTVFCFRTYDDETRRYIQGRYGKNLSLLKYNTSFGKIIEEKYSGYCIEEWDFVSLSKGEVIAGLPFEKPFRFQIDIYGR